MPKEHPTRYEYHASDAVVPPTFSGQSDQSCGLGSTVDKAGLTSQRRQFLWYQIRAESNSHEGAEDGAP